MKEEKDEVVVQEVSDDTLDAGLEIRNSIFSPITKEQWKQGQEKSGSIAFIGNEPVGFIPLLYSHIQIDSTRTIKAAYENAVGTMEAARGRGIGCKMIEGASQFLKDQADMLLVFRGAERSRGYHFYEKTGHVDLQYIRSHSCDTKNGKMHENVTILSDFNAVLDAQKQVLPCFEQTYHGLMGFQKRHDRYWQEAFKRPYYFSRSGRFSMKFLLLQLKEKQQTTAYALLSLEEPKSSANVKQIKLLEMASLGADIQSMKKVLESAMAYAQKQDLDKMTAVIGDDHPFLSLFQSIGFISEPRGLMHMGLSFDSKGLMNKLWSDSLQMPGVNLQVRTPQEDFSVGPDHDGAKQVTLEMKQSTLTQWMMGRIDFRSRVKEGTITIQNGNDQIVNHIHKSIPLQRWEYHDIDFV